MMYQTCGVLESAVLRVVPNDVQLRQLYVGIHHQRVRFVPAKDEILGRVGHCFNKVGYYSKLYYKLYYIL